MATQLQDLQAKRKELQATNPNATMLDAKSALSPTPIANAPVAGVAPAITPTTPTTPTAPVSVHDNPTYQSNTTEQYNQGVLAQNKANVAARGTPTMPAGTKTPNGSTLNADGTITPVAPTVTPTVTSEVTSQTTLPSVTPSAEELALNKKVGGVIQQNGLNSIQPAKTNTSVSDRNFNIGGPDITKKTTPVPTTRDIALSNKLGQYSAMTSQQFVDLMKQGQIPSTVSSQLVANPQFQQAQQEYSQFLKTNNINNSGRAVYNAMTGGQPEQAVNPLVEISNNLLKAFGVDGTQGSYLDAFKESISQNEAVRTKTLELNAKNAQIDEKVQARDNILKDLKATHQGVPLSTLVAMASRDAQPINDEITTLQRDVKQLSSDLQFETELAKSEYDAKTKDMEAKTNIRNTILGNLMNAQFGLATKQMEAQMADQIAKQAFNDPLKATQGILEQYTKMGVIPSKVAQVYAEEAQDYVDRGGKLSDYLNTMIGEFQASEGFKSYQAKQTGTEWQSANITRYNPSTGANESTPIFYRKKTNGQGGFEAVDLSGNPIDASLLSGTGTGVGGGATGDYSTSTTEMRTDRNMNPTAFTVDIAKQAGLVEGVDYVKGDKFPGSSNLYTAKLIGDPIETTIRAIDAIGFKTKSGQNRWTYTDKLGLNNDTWAKMSPTDKATAIKKMYQQEGGNGKAIGGIGQPTQSQFNPLQVKEFEAYNGTTIPSQYKTPMEQDQFVKDYNAWRGTNTATQIKTGDDLLKVNTGDKATEGEKTAVRYGARMLDVVNKLKDSKVEEYFTSLPVAEQVLQDYIYPEIAKSDKMKEMNAYKNDFITAVLRRESGAAIGKDEYIRENKKYFPQPGDSQNVVLAKQNARNFAVKALLRDAGKDTQGNIISSLYNPEAYNAPVEQKDTKSRIADIKKKANIK